MLRTASTIKGYAITAKDGTIGTVSDFLFDDATWSVRWLVVDTGNFLSRHKVLLPASAVTHLAASERQFAVELTVRQIQDSPEVDTELPVSRQTEGSIYDFYGWNPYWGTGAFPGGYGFTGGIAPGSLDEANIAQAAAHQGDPHLRSIAAVTGYHIEANDGNIGHVADFVVRDGEWRIEYLVINTNNWWPGKKVLISPKSVKEIDWPEHSVEVNAARQAVKDSPAYDPSVAIDPLYEERFHRHYG